MVARPVAREEEEKEGLLIFHGKGQGATVTLGTAVTRGVPLVREFLGTHPRYTSVVRIHL